MHKRKKKGDFIKSKKSAQQTANLTREGDHRDKQTKQRRAREPAQVKGLPDIFSQQKSESR